MCIATIQHQEVDLVDEDVVGQRAEEVDLRVEEEIDLLQGGHILGDVIGNDVVMSLQRIGWEQENLRGFGGEQVLPGTFLKLFLAINRLLASHLFHLLLAFNLLLAFHQHLVYRCT